MKNNFIGSLAFVFIHFWASAQIELPRFLIGTWQVNEENSFEHWDLLNENRMLGFSYTNDIAKKAIKEYLRIENKGKKQLYFASVLDQNNGASIKFKRSKWNDSMCVFENKQHDFPKEISYTLLQNGQVLVNISDFSKKNYSYKLTKINASNTEEPPDLTGSNPNYNADLAKKYMADDYGMKTFVLVILKSGVNKNAAPDSIKAAFRSHLDNIALLVAQEKLVVAGPLSTNDNNYRGIFIIDTDSKAEASRLLEPDLALGIGLLEAEYFTWYGSAALGAYLPFADKIWKIKP